MRLHCALRISAILLSTSCCALPLATRAADEHPLAIESHAPDFKLPGVDGKQYSLADFADAKVLVVVFTCNHCPTAQAYEERIARLAEDYRKRGVALVAISPNDPLAVRLDELGYTDVGDSLDDMKIRAKDRAFTFPYLYDGETQQVSRAYGPAATPHVFVFDAERRLRYHGRVDDSAREGAVTTHDARAAIDAVLMGERAPAETTRTFGCSIKWSDKRESARESLRRWDQEQASLETIDAAGVKRLVANDSKKLRVINAWATWCGPCVQEFPELITMHRMYRQRDFELITISADPADRKSQVLAFLNERHASNRNFQFEGKNEYELAEALDAKWQGALPYTIVVAPGGKVIYRRQDAVDPLALRKVIADALGRVYP